MKGAAFMGAGSKTVVVDLDNSLVIGVLDNSGRRRGIVATMGIRASKMPEFQLNHSLNYGRISIMRSFLVACLVAVLLAAGAAFVLNSFVPELVIGRFLLAGCSHLIWPAAG